MKNRSPTVLLVDDDADELEVASRALLRAGIEGFELAPNGETALHYLGLDDESLPHEDSLPEVIFLDLKMPRVDGLRVLREIRSHETTRAIPVVVLSSSRHPQDISRSYAEGANSFVVKRFDPRHPGAYIADVARYWLGLNEGPPAHSGTDTR